MGEKSDLAKMWSKIGKGFLVFMLVGAIFMIIDGLIK